MTESNTNTPTPMVWHTVEDQQQRHRLAIVPTANGIWIGWPGGSTFMAAKRQFAKEGVEDVGIRAPMTGRIAKVMIAPGDRVQEGALLIIMEAMKMEYRLTAPYAGEIISVSCAEGQLVDLNTTLVQIEQANDSPPPHRE